MTSLKSGCINFQLKVSPEIDRLVQVLATQIHDERSRLKRKEEEQILHLYLEEPCAVQPPPPTRWPGMRRWNWNQTTLQYSAVQYRSPLHSRVNGLYSTVLYSSEFSELIVRYRFAPALADGSHTINTNFERQPNKLFYA